MILPICNTCYLSSLCFLDGRRRAFEKLKRLQLSWLPIHCAYNASTFIEKHNSFILSIKLIGKGKYTCSEDKSHLACSTSMVRLLTMKPNATNSIEFQEEMHNFLSFIANAEYYFCHMTSCQWNDRIHARLSN